MSLPGRSKWFPHYKRRQFLYFKCQTAWKSVKCITKKRQALLYCNAAVTGGFVCSFLVHFHEFGQMGSGVSYAGFFVAPAPTTCACTVWPPAHHPTSLSAAQCALVNVLPVQKPSGDPCPQRWAHREAGKAAATLHAWCFWTQGHQMNIISTAIRPA